MQHSLLAALDDSRNKAVRLFTVDFSKAFYNVRHHLLAQVSWKIKEQSIKPASSKLVFKFPIRSEATGIM